MKLFTLFVAVATYVFAQQATPAPSVTAAPAAAAVDPPEEILSGSIDFGYRWVTGVGGSFDTYRSIVDLGSGPKLLGADFTIRLPNNRFFDRIDVRAADWGGDPYSTFHIDVRKARLYNFSGDYRNIAYYNNLPAFADPLLSSGVVLNEQALDTRKKIGDYRLELFPNHMIVPYLEYEHNSDNGTGISTFVSDANEYPVASLERSSTENYRAGARLELKHFHAKVEFGGTTFKDAQQLNSSQTSYGNSFSPVLGQTLDLTGLSEAYGVRGHSIYTDASFSSNPLSWADFYGSILYSEPVTNVNFQGLSTGNQVLEAQVLFYTGEQDLILAMSKQPHTSASLGAEMRPFTRLRVIPAWFTDRMHTGGSATGQQTLTTASGAVPIASLDSSSLVTNSNQAGLTLMFDLTRKITLRGGYRYTWGNASNVILPIAELAGFEQGKIRENVTLAGVSWRPMQNTWVNVDFEDGSSGSTYFRTSLYNYQKARVRGRQRISPSLSLSASASVLHNSNPSPGFNYEFLDHQESASFVYSPANGKIWDFEGGYTRATLHSNISYLDPEFLITEQSFYRVNSHAITAMFDINLRKAKLSLGGSAFLASGSNPNTFYQPAAKLAVALRKNISWMSEWRYYGFGESFYGYQGFRTEMVTTGLRLTR